MPVALVPLAGFAIAILAAVCAIAVDWLIQQIAKALPSISFIHLGSIFSDAASGVLSWCVQNGKGYFDDISHWFIAHEYILRQVAFNTIQVLQHLGDQIAHIVVSEIPDAIKRADAYALREVDRAAKDLRDDIRKAERAALSALSAADRAIYKKLAEIDGSVESSAKALVAHAVTTAENYTDTAVGDLKSYVDNQVTAAEQIAATNLDKLAKQVGAAVAGAASTAATNLAATATDLGNTITSDVTNLAGTVSSDVGTLAGELTTDVQTFEGDLTNLQGVLETLIATSIAGVVAELAHAEECMVTTCDGPNNLSTLLNDLLGIADFAAFAAFISTAINNPGSAVATFSSAASGLYSDADSLLDTLLSI